MARVLCSCVSNFSGRSSRLAAAVFCGRSVTWRPDVGLCVVTAVVRYVGGGRGSRCCGSWTVQERGKGVVVVVVVVVRVRSNVKTNGCLFVADDDKLFPTRRVLVKFTTSTLPQATSNTSNSTTTTAMRPQRQRRQQRRRDHNDNGDDNGNSDDKDNNKMG